MLFFGYIRNVFKVIISKLSFLCKPVITDLTKRN
jgi:hypothetical protein